MSTRVVEEVRVDEGSKGSRFSAMRTLTGHFAVRRVV